MRENPEGHTTAKVLLCCDILLSSARCLLPSCVGNNMLAPRPCASPSKVKLSTQETSPGDCFCNETVSSKDGGPSKLRPARFSALCRARDVKVVGPRVQMEKMVGVQKGPLGEKGVNCELRYEQ